VKENKKKVTRLEYSVRNTSMAIISNIASMIVGYLLRVVFTHTLSESYVGLNGLFTDIVQVLSLSEMGIGTAITYALYRPVAEENIEKQKSLMRLIRNFYRLVIVLAAMLGCALIPFMRLLIKDYNDAEHVILIYILYVTNTICSYLLIYKKTLLDAQQKMYIGVFFQTLSWIIQDVLKMAALVIWHDLILFLVIGIASTLLCNIAISWTADRSCPYLRDKEVKQLPKEEKKELYANIRAMMMHKVGTVVVNNTDNLILSACVGLLSVGSYSNYHLVILTVQQLLYSVYKGTTASVGNLGVMEDKKDVQKVFDELVFIGQWMYGVAFICLFELLNPAIKLSFGEQYVFSRDIVFVLCLIFYIQGLRNPVLTFRDSMGLFWYDRYKALVEGGLNIVLSLILVRYMGVIGVFLGTVFSMSLTSVWIEPFVLHKYGFKSSCRNHFRRQGLYCARMAVIWLITDFVCGVAAASARTLLAEIFIRLIVCVVLPDILLLLIYHHTDPFKCAVQIAADFIKSKIKR